MNENLLAFLKPVSQSSGGRRTQGRGTYTEPNALQFKNIFDSIIASGFKEEHILSAEECGYTMGTLYVKCQEALTYLVNTEKKECTNGPFPYGEIRKQYFISRDTDRVLIRRRGFYTREVTSSVRTRLDVPLTYKETRIKILRNLSLDGNEITSDISYGSCSKWTDCVEHWLHESPGGKVLQLELTKMDKPELAWLEDYFLRLEGFASYAVEGETVTITKL